MLTSEFCTATHALVYLAHKAKMVSSDELARNICTHPVCVRKVLSKLKKAGLVGTKEGLDGGYYLSKTPDKINLRMLGEILQVNFMGNGWRSGNPQVADCHCADGCKAEQCICGGMSSVMTDIGLRINRVCQQSLEDITILSIMQQLFV